MKRQKGFTLIEMMVVVAIIGLLATLILPRVLGRQEQAQVEKAKADIQALSSAMKLYKLDNFNYPSTQQGLDALLRKPGGDPPANNWKQGGYIERLPKDPWGNDYQYLSPGQHGDFDIWSFGSDGKPGGGGTAADIGNWDTNAASG